MGSTGGRAHRISNKIPDASLTRGDITYMQIWHYIFYKICMVFITTAYNFRLYYISSLSSGYTILPSCQWNCIIFIIITYLSPESAGILNQKYTALLGVALGQLLMSFHNDIINYGRPFLSYFI